MRLFFAASRSLLGRLARTLTMLKRFLGSITTACLLTATASSAVAQAYTDEQLVTVWEQLTRSEREEVSEWFRFEAEGLATGQNELIRLVASQVEIDQGYWPTEGPKSYFNPGGMRQPIAADASEAVELRERLGLGPETRLWTYDFGSRRLIRHGALRDPDRIFRDALAGHAPGLEFTVAELCRRLDDGSLLNEHAALSRAYSDAKGRVYPEVSLFDYLAADVEHTLSETDARSVLFFVEDRVAADEPSVNETAIAEVHRRVREVFDRARAARETIETFAAVYLFPKPELDERYGDVLALHALWLSADVNPELLRDRLPTSHGLDAFLAEWNETFRLERLRTDATYRQRGLSGSEYHVRALLESVLQQFGAFEPREPAPDPELIAVAPEPAKPLIELEAGARAVLFEKLEKLNRRDRAKLIEACREAALNSGAPQVELVQLWSGRIPTPVDTLKGPTRFAAHDAKVYKGGPVRREIGPGDRLWDGFSKRIVRDAPPEPHWRYDYEPATRRIVVLEPESDKLSELTQLLQGGLPDEDLARAVLLSQFEVEGTLLAETEFFAHAYSDRDGNAYEGLSLAEVWSSSVELEVPDVDALAYIMKVWHDPTVKPPLSQADHNKWYPRMGESLARVRHRKQLTRALAEVWFDGRPALRDGYEASIDLMHALIARSGENATRISEGLDRDERLYLDRGLKAIVGLGEAGWNAGNERRDSLLAGREEIRQAVLGVLAAEGWITD